MYVKHLYPLNLYIMQLQGWQVVCDTFQSYTCSTSNYGRYTNVHICSTNWELFQQVFMEGIVKDPSPEEPLSKWATGRQYLLHPVGGLMTYNRRGKREKRNPDVPFQEATLVLEPVSLTVSEVLKSCNQLQLQSILWWLQEDEDVSKFLLQFATFYIDLFDFCFCFRNLVCLSSSTCILSVTQPIWRSILLCFVINMLFNWALCRHNIVMVWSF